MKKNALLLICVFAFQYLFSQVCVSGDCQNGKGVYKNEAGDVYEGSFVNGKPNGSGTERYNKPLGAEGEYVGEFKNGKRNGQGTYTWNSGLKISAQWSEGMPVHGIKSFPDGTIYDGYFKTNTLNPDGQGKMKWTNGDEYIGEWNNGQRHGKGKMFKSGSLFQEGIFINDKFNDDVAVTDNTILNNGEHYIHYTFSGNNINIYIEDLKDDDLNLDIQYVERNWGKGTINGEYKTYYSDGCKIEFDINQDGRLTQSDIGFLKISKSQKAGAHFLPEFNNGIQFGFENDRKFKNGPAFIDESKSDCTYSIDKGHMVYVFTIPLDEIFVQGNFKMMFRVIVDRTATNPKPNVVYREFIYPEAQERKYLGITKFFTLDFSNSTAKEILAYKERKRQQLEEMEAKTSDASLLRKLYTIEAKKRAKRIPPIYDGLYIETTSGLFIEIPSQPCYYGKILKDKIRLVWQYDDLTKQPVNPYFLKDCFDTLRFIQIEKSEFKAIRMVAGGKFKKVVDYLTFHNVNKYPLKPLPGGNFYLYKAGTYPGEYHSGEVSNTIMYWFDNPKLELYSEPAESWSYKYTMNNPVEENHFYGAWAGENIWLFEIVPDKSISIKPTQVKKVGSNIKSTKKR